MLSIGPSLEKSLMYLLSFEPWVSRILRGGAGWEVWQAPNATLLLVRSTWRGILLRDCDQMAQRVPTVTSHKASGGIRQSWMQWRGER